MLNYFRSLISDFILQSPLNSQRYLFNALDDSTKEINRSENRFQLNDIRNTYNIKLQNK